MLATATCCGENASTASSSASSTPPTNRKYRSDGHLMITPPARHARFSRLTGDIAVSSCRRWQGSRAAVTFSGTECRFGCKRLNSTGGHRRTSRLIGVDVDEPDQHAGILLPALHVNRIADYAAAVGQMAAIPALEGAGDLDVLYRIVIGISKRERHQRFRAQPAPPPRLRGDFQSADRRLRGCRRLRRRAERQPRLPQPGRHHREPRAEPDP